MKSPAFQFYPADWLADANVAMASLEEEGAYIRLLCFAWREGYIPKCPIRCASLVGKGASTTLAQMVQGWFNQHPTDDTKLVHPRLEVERQKQQAWHEKSVEGGKKSAAKRSANRVRKPIPRVVDKCLPNGASQKATLLSSSSSSVRTSFDVFWSEYPKKIAKQAAEKAWRSKKCDSLSEIIIAALVKHREQEQWKKDGGEFIPNASTWLNQRRWEDELKPQSNTPSTAQYRDTPDPVEWADWLKGRGLDYTPHCRALATWREHFTKR